MAGSARRAIPRPGAVLRRVAGEPCLLLGGPRALLLQVAHPKIAAGVAEHSDFRRQPWLRLWRTLDAAVLLVFGSRAQAERAARAAHRVHDRVRGRMPEAGGRWAAGATYSAHDPGAQAWVIATLADTSEVVFQRMVRSLRAGEREALWEDWRRVGLFFGVPPSRLPGTYGAYRAYLEAMLTGDEIEVTPTARALSAHILRPRVPLLPGSAWEPAVALTSGLLPPALRRAYGLPFGPRQRAEVRRWCTAQRLAHRVVPRMRRRLPQVYAGARRVIRPAALEGLG